MNYTFNKTLIEQVKAGTHCIEFNREKDSLEMLQALLDTAFPEDKMIAIYDYKYYEKCCEDDGLWDWTNTTDKTPIPLSNFVQPEQSERDVMAELDERLKRLEDILLNGENYNIQYVRCVQPTSEYYTFNKIYKATKNTQYNGSYNFVNDLGNNDISGSKLFVPATFQEYEAQQNKPEIVNPVRWRAEKGGLFYFVDYMLDINTMPEDFSHYTTVLYNSGNYYKTKEQAEEMAVLMQFTLNNPELVKQLMDKKE